MSHELCKTCLKRTLNFGRKDFLLYQLFIRNNSSGRNEAPPKQPLHETLKIGWKRLPGELKLLKEEINHAIHFQPMVEKDMHHGNYEVIYK